ncbi:hypothetical protein LTR70_004754 [Exophiala xenobiotica]|uniref:Uncharacterized protein n=1 Tax=Lithohypha guttulata TaxID=1690604 RepID=A0ABR0KC95_9EURO|nr:hypothetical protein LTR24_004370 [Lithohypha guttulata]KAK5319968.1 hypothetical protein LTR70_004754 [Exophiala xenobiotica]
MNSARRRCHSEQLAITKRNPVRLIPPHRAAKLREAQLRLGSSNVHLTSSIGLTGRHESLNTIAPPSLADEQISAPTSTSYPPTTSSKAPELKSSQSKLPGTKQQLDGAAHFPNIDAVIEGSSNRDKRRTMAETEYYEQMDKEGVVTRTSILRPVNKEDCLVARGANPRTGLITPEANSVADSLDFGKRFTNNRQDSSAQWRLDGDQWVSSVVAQAQPATGATPNKAHIRPLGRVAEEYLSPDHARGQPRRDVSPLTESNLHQLAGEQKPLPPAPQAQAAATTAPGIRKIRRKPVSSPSEQSPEIHTGRLADRQPSNETVVRTPLHDSQATGRGGIPTYFRPEDIGSNPAIHVRPHLAGDGREESPFLGMPVKHRIMTTRPPRGFTAGNMNLDQLQQSLRTNSGPYPLPPSKQRPTPTEKYREPPSTSLPRRKLYGPMGTFRDEERIYPQPVPRAYPPNTATFFDHTRQMRRHQCYEEHQRPQKSTDGQRTRNVAQFMPEDPEDRSYLEGMNPHQKSNTMCMNIDTSTPTFSKQADKSSIATPSGVLSGRTVLQDHTVTNKCPIRTDTANTVSSPTLGQSMKRTSMDESLPPERRPPMGPRSQEVRHFPKTTNGETTTALEHPSNMTGTKVDQSDEDEKSEDSQACSGSKSRILAETGVASDDDDKPVLIDARGLPGFDCHEGCLGHLSPAVSLAESETSSLVSMGVFDASFETSVQAVNKVLLEPSKPPISRLGKVKTAFVRGPRPRPGSPTKSFVGQDLRRRIMRKSPTPQETTRQYIGDPKKPVAKSAVTAAVRAMDVDDSSPEEVVNLKRPTAKTYDIMAHTAVQKPPKKRQAGHEANEGRRVSGKAEACSDRMTIISRGMPDEALSKEPPAQDDGKSNMLARMSSLVRRPNFRWSCIKKHPRLLSHTQGLLVRLKDMVFVVLDTTSLISVMAFEYKREGRIVIPKGISTSELFGNFLQSMLYLMIAACIYAWVVKVLRVILVVVRVILLPVRICAWIVG